MKKLTLMLLLATPVFGQDKPAPVTPAAPEELTTLEKQGLSNIYKQYQEVLNELSNANIDVTKAHPGYHLDPQNPFSGKLVKNDPPKADKPEKK